jgi:aminopeptidase N
VLHLDSGQQPAAAGSSGDSSVFYFNQKVCIPSYLIALAVGELEKRDLSER